LPKPSNNVTHDSYESLALVRCLIRMSMSIELGLIWTDPE